MNGQTTEQSAVPASGDTASNLPARYGHTPSRKRRERVIAWSVGIAIALVFIAWVVWVASNGDGSVVEGRDTGHVVIDDRSTKISFEVSMPAGSTASCALQVQSNEHAIVGWKVVDIPASTKYTQSFTEFVRSSELGVTGLIYRCWLA